MQITFDAGYGDTADDVPQGIKQALIAYTKNGAYASFEEKIKGTLEPGKLADFVILNEDIFSIDPIHIKDMKVLQTYVGGHKVFDFNEN